MRSYNEGRKQEHKYNSCDVAKVLNNVEAEIWTVHDGEMWEIGDTNTVLEHYLKFMGNG